MPDDGFAVLCEALYKQGVSTSYADRLLTELREHRCDLEAERLTAGDAPIDAARRARRSLGTDAAILGQVLSRAELRGRWCGVRAAFRPLQYAFAAPEAPWPNATLAGPAIARWSVSISLGSVLTCAMLLALARTVLTGA